MDDISARGGGPLHGGLAGFNYRNPTLYGRDTDLDIILEKLIGQRSEMFRNGTLRDIYSQNHSPELLNSYKRI